MAGGNGGRPSKDAVEWSRGGDRGWTDFEAAAKRTQRQLFELAKAAERAQRLNTKLATAISGSWNWPSGASTSSSFAVTGFSPSWASELSAEEQLKLEAKAVGAKVWRSVFQLKQRDLSRETVEWLSHFDKNFKQGPLAQADLSDDPAMTGLWIVTWHNLRSDAERMHETIRRGLEFRGNPIAVDELEEI